MLDKLSNKIAAMKADKTEVTKERGRSISSDRHNSMSPTNSLTTMNTVTFSLQDDTPSITIPTRQLPKISSDTGSLSTLTSSSSAIHISPSRRIIDYLTLNTDFSGMKLSVSKSSNLSTVTTKSSTSSLGSTGTAHSSIITPSHSPRKLKSIQNMFTLADNSKDVVGGVKERLITKIDPVEMTVKPTIVTVPQDTVRRSAVLLAGPKFRLNIKEILKNKLKLNSDTMYSISISVGIISLIITLWKPISSFFSGFIVGCLFAIVTVYVWFRMIINTKVEETAIEEWIDFPALDSMLTKVDKENKNTYVQATGAFMSFHSYDADRDDDFVRYPCDVRLDGYRLIIQLASKPWSEEKKPDKEIKFIGCREYLIKEARMMLVPEVTLTRSKYWMNEYPIVIQDLQILDKQIFSKQQLEKSKLDTNDFFKNNATTLSIWFETSPQKEEWFHKLSLVLRKGKEEIERVKYLASTNGSLSSSILNSYLYQRQAQTDADTVLVPNPVTEANIRASVIETQINAEELQQRAKEKESENAEKDASGTHRTIARKSKKLIPNETSLQKVLQTPECLDEAAITINFMIRRLLCDIFHTPVLKDLLKNKIEMKLKEIAVSILENLRVVSIDLGKTFPIILKIEPMQWNTQGIWFNLFLYYRGNFKLSIKSRVVLQKLINYDPKNDKPIFAQHQISQIVHKDNENINEDDLIQRQKLLAKEPEIPEMAITRRLGTVLTNLALNKYFQIFVNLPFIKTLFEKFSQKDVGIDVELTSFSGILTLNIPPPPSDRIWVGFPEMPDFNIKVTPTYGEKQYSYILLQDFLAAKVRAELKRLVVLPAMDDQLLPFFRDWVIDIIGDIISKPVNPLTDNYKTKLNVQTAVREGLQEYKNAKNVKRQSPILSTSSGTTRVQT
ncbi:unnamed protein product [Rotaria sordida]|uniref:SMP-LTD domain-containing protein n=1 Tax=Rotaria sordida TaxID=392033 RepID=A0A813WUG3_9BILA|nr:unnamed protein product [Rotaria sordida]CAF0857399.1 unnamed protein product [Rotaria sordida]